jgi:hypothetical protein
MRYQWNWYGESKHATLGEFYFNAHHLIRMQAYLLYYDKASLINFLAKGSAYIKENT